MRLVLATRNEHKLHEFERRWTASRSSRCRRRDASARAGRDVRRERARQGARGGGGARPRGDRATTRASRPRRSAAHRGSSPRASPGPARPTRATSPSCARRRRRDRACATSAWWRTRSPAAQEQAFEGSCTGTLAADPRGAGGFGYDPAFLPDEVADGRTMAELTGAEKDAISHRGRAARALLAWLSPRGAHDGRGPESVVGASRARATRRTSRTRMRAGVRRSSASRRPSSSSRSSSAPAWRPGRSPSSPRRRTRPRTSSPRC